MYVSMSQYGIGRECIKMWHGEGRIYIKICLKSTKNLEDSMDAGMSLDEASYLYTSLGQVLQDADRAMQAAGQEDTP